MYQNVSFLRILISVFFLDFIVVAIGEKWNKTNTFGCTYIQSKTFLKEKSCIAIYMTLECLQSFNK